MAPITHLYRLVWGGRLFDKESWSCSLHVHSAAGLNLAASNFSAALVAFHGRSSGHASSAAKLDFIKFNEINPVTGKYLLPTTNELLQDGLAAGLDAPGPGQIACVVSTTTALARGRAHAGRFFMPIGSIPVDALTGLLPTMRTGEVLSNAITLCNDLNTVVGPGSSLCVFSKVGQSQEKITGVRIGRVLDTMRSRRASLPEQYTGGALA